MDLARRFGKVVSRLTPNHPSAARKVLEIGWRAFGVKLRRFPDKRLMPADRYLAWMLMRAMCAPLRDPCNSAIASIFMVGELLQEAGLHPYNAEAFSSYISASFSEQAMLEKMDDLGASPTLCSYHRIIMGGAEMGFMPRPRCIVHTNLICDANLVSFRRMARTFDVPLFYVDVPSTIDDGAIAYVAEQLRELKVFLEEITGRRIGHEALVARVASSKRSLENYRRFQEVRGLLDTPTDIISPMYCALSNNLMLGTPEEERYTRLLVEGIGSLGPARTLKVYWMHALPFWAAPVKEMLDLSDRAQITGAEIGEVLDPGFDPEKPYEAMATRMVRNALNGPATRRIANGIANARRTRSDGAIWFNQWGCKHTIGVARLAKEMFEEAGIPLLVIDGDGCDRSHGGEGQLATRLGAFLEMLEEMAGIDASNRGMPRRRDDVAGADGSAGIATAGSSSDEGADGAA